MFSFFHVFLLPYMLHVHIHNNARFELTWHLIELKDMKTEEPMQNMHAREKRVTDHCCTKKVWKKKKKKDLTFHYFRSLTFSYSTNVAIPWTSMADIMAKNRAGPSLSLLGHCLGPPLPENIPNLRANLFIFIYKYFFWDIKIF